MRIPFGKYKGEEIADIDDLGYLKWVEQQDFITSELRGEVQFVIERLEGDRPRAGESRQGSRNSIMILLHATVKHGFDDRDGDGIYSRGSLRVCSSPQNIVDFAYSCLKLGLDVDFVPRLTRWPWSNEPTGETARD